MISVPNPVNEKVQSYEVGSPARESLKRALDAMSHGASTSSHGNIEGIKNTPENTMPENIMNVPCIIGGTQIFTGSIKKIIMPHAHNEVLGQFHVAGPAEMKNAVAAALKAKPEWEAMPWQKRVAVFLKAADLLAGPYRDILNAATMLGQSKNAYQAEIDSACELIDFFRFNACFYQQILKEQPLSSPGVWNTMEYRPLEGFVLAITPFNFTSIAGNLPTAPAMLGNTVIWKPASTQMLSAYYIMSLLKEAGLPDGVVNLVPSEGSMVAKTLLPSKDLAGVHFTGSTETFQSIWRTISDNLSNYRSYPRLVGETGGKDFVFVHQSADAEAVATALLRGAFEYQGQKCSAASRAYIPKSLSKKIETLLVSELKTISMGDVRDFRNFTNAVIDKNSFNKISDYIEHASSSTDAEIICGGKRNDKIGYFIEPTVIKAKSPHYRSMVEEIFGPVLTLFVYEDSELDEALRLCDETSPYALTGAVFAQDSYAIEKIAGKLRHSAGNFYINDKPTGAVVGQQPFGGGRLSGTNDKAGSSLNLYRWLSARSIKECFSPAKDYRYPFMREQ